MNYTASMDTFEELLQLEDQLHLWDAKVRGLHLWALVRSPVFQRLTRQAADFVPTPRRTWKVSASRAQLVRDARTFQILVSPPSQSYDALFFAEGFSRYASDENTSFDRRLEPIYALYEHPLVLESHNALHIDKPDRSLGAEIYSQNIIWYFSSLFGRISRLKPSEKAVVYDFARTVALTFGIEDWEAFIVSRTEKLISFWPHVLQIVAKFIVPKLRHTSLVWVDNACYLNRQGLVTRALHEQGLRVAEVQHGIIYPQHYAYNYPVSCLQESQHPCRLYLPDLFLTYGDYWKGQNRIPSEQYTVGHVQLSRTVRALKQLKGVDGQILVISGDARTLELTHALAKHFPQRKIILKLHPGETSLYASYTNEMSYPNVAIVLHDDVYRLVAESEIVIGYNSTVLIEAAAFPNKRIFFYEKNIIPPTVGSRFSSIPDAIEQISDLTSGYGQATPDTFWALNYEDRLKAFSKAYLEN